MEILAALFIGVPVLAVCAVHVAAQLIRGAIALVRALRRPRRLEASAWPVELDLAHRARM